MSGFLGVIAEGLLKSLPAQLVLAILRHSFVAWAPSVARLIVRVADKTAELSFSTSVQAAGQFAEMDPKDELFHSISYSSRTISIAVFRLAGVFLVGAPFAGIAVSLVGDGVPDSVGVLVGLLAVVPFAVFLRVFSVHGWRVASLSSLTSVAALALGRLILPLYVDRLPTSRDISFQVVSTVNERAGRTAAIAVGVALTVASIAIMLGFICWVIRLWFRAVVALMWLPLDHDQKGWDLATSQILLLIGPFSIIGLVKNFGIEFPVEAVLPFAILAWLGMLRLGVELFLRIVWLVDTLRDGGELTVRAVAHASNGWNEDMQAAATRHSFASSSA